MMFWIKLPTEKVEGSSAREVMWQADVWSEAVCVSWAWQKEMAREAVFYIVLPWRCAVTGGFMAKDLQKVVEGRAQVMLIFNFWAASRDRVLSWQ